MFLKKELLVKELGEEGVRVFLGMVENALMRNKHNGFMFKMFDLGWLIYKDKNAIKAWKDLVGRETRSTYYNIQKMTQKYPEMTLDSIVSKNLNALENVLVEVLGSVSQNSKFFIKSCQEYKVEVYERIFGPSANNSGSGEEK